MAWTSKVLNSHWNITADSFGTYGDSAGSFTITRDYLDEQNHYVKFFYEDGTTCASVRHKFNSSTIFTVTPNVDTTSNYPKHKKIARLAVYMEYWLGSPELLVVYWTGSTVFQNRSKLVQENGYRDLYFNAGLPDGIVQPSNNFAFDNLDTYRDVGGGEVNVGMFSPGAGPVLFKKDYWGANLNALQIKSDYNLLDQYDSYLYPYDIQISNQIKDALNVVASSNNSLSSITFFDTTDTTSANRRTFGIGGDQKLFFTIRGTSASTISVISDDPIDLSERHCYGARYDFSIGANSYVKLYVDGVLVKTSVTGSVTFSSTTKTTSFFKCTNYPDIWYLGDMAISNRSSFSDQWMADAAATMLDAYPYGPDPAMSYMDTSAPTLAGGPNYTFGMEPVIENSAGPWNFQISAGSLPDGLTLDSSTGVISGQLDSGVTSGDYTFTVTDIT